MTQKLNEFLHRHLLLCLLFMYGSAAIFPAPGLAIRDFELFPRLSLPLLMLSFLLFNAGLAVRPADLKRMTHRKTKILLVGLLANILVPMLFLVLLSVFGRQWHSFSELQTILVGIAIIGAMPIAGSSTAWAQNADGNLAISLGLVVLSTSLSPIVTPFGFHLASLVTQGDYGKVLSSLGEGSVLTFLAVSVVVPAFLGVGTRALVGEQRIGRTLPYFKSLNLFNLLILNYSNAAVALPQAFSNPDYDFLVLIISVTFVLSASTFLGGKLVAIWMKADPSETVSLMYGLGMNNNGTGLVLASTYLHSHPLMMLPIIFFNLEQQLIAGVVGTWLVRNQRLDKGQGFAKH